MEQADIEFFEEYKRLDGLCSDMYSSPNGISAYIEQMESEYVKGSYRVPRWDADYDMLKRVRWTRNKIAHDSNGYQISTPADLDFLKTFHKRILEINDPLALLQKGNKEHDQTMKEKQTEQVPDAEMYMHTETPYKRKSQGWIGYFLLAAVLAAVVLVCLFAGK